MASDSRVLFLARQEIDRVLSEAAAGPDDLHAELHALATKVATLEARVAELEVKPSPSASRAQAAKKTTANT